MPRRSSLAKTNRDVALEVQSRLICAALDEKGWSQADLARATGLREYTVSRVKNGKTLASSETGRRVAAALNLDPALIGQVEFREAPNMLAEGLNRQSEEDGKVRLTLNVVIEPGLARLIETLMDYDKPIGSARMSLILNALYAPLPGGGSE